MCLAVALKAQAQSRATLTALVEMKRPKQPSFVAQQNIGANQQINHAVLAPMSAENRIPPIKLLEISDGERLDGRTADAASSTDQAVETVGEVDGAENNRG